MQRKRDMKVRDRMYRLEKASDIIDSVIDTMLEVGNGVTIDHIIEARRDLFEARDIIDDYVDKPTSYDVDNPEFLKGGAEE